MTRNLSFLNHEWFWPIVILALLIWFVFIWKDSYKYPKVKFIINIVISLIALTALTLILLKPLKYNSGKPLKAVILTNGYHQNQLDSLKQIYNDLAIINYEGDKQLLNDLDSPESIFVLGDGVLDFDLWKLDDIETIYLKGREPKGITNISYNTKNKVGNTAIFKGHYLNATKGHKLILENPSGKYEDSIVLSSEKRQAFELSGNLKTKGNFLYHIVEIDSLKVIITKNPLPISVAEEKLLRILIINEFPTFETKYLKNYLSKKGHQVLVRSQLTKERYKYEYFNMKHRNTVSFSQKNLALFDLIIIDAPALNKLSKSNRNAIKTVIRNTGLGVYIQPEVGFLNANSRLVSFKFQRDKNTSTRLETWPRVKINTFAYTFKPEFILQSTIASNSKIVSANKRLGLGRIGTSVINNSYELLLNGHPEVYQHLWSKTLESLGKKETPATAWYTSTFLSFPNEPLDFKLRSQIEQPIVKSGKNVKVPLRQDIDITSLWSGLTYPKSIGWNTLKTEQDSINIMNYYVSDNNTWKALRAQKTIIANEHYANRNSGQDKERTNSPTTPMSLNWLYTLFIGCIGYLWLEPKL